MPVLLDTDVAIELMRGNHDTLAMLARHDGDVFVSSVTAAELFYGAYHSKRMERNVACVSAFLAQFRRLTLTDESSRIFGEVKEYLRSKSTPIDTFDLLIAAMALENHCTLATGNTKHFSKIEDLTLVNWCRFSAET